MRRALVLTDESARHPFRASLPPHLRFAHDAGPAEKQANWRARWALDAGDIRGFATAYVATLAAMIALLF